MLLCGAVLSCLSRASDGLSTGRPLEKALCADILCVYDYLIESGYKTETVRVRLLLDFSATAGF